VQDTSYLLRASERVGVARKLSQLHPSGESCDEKQGEITSAAVLNILCALDSCGGLDLSANGDKTSHIPGVRSKEKDEKNLLAELIGTKGTYR
jgi:hypothetical protein